jgi:hypothetical protein
VGLARFEPGWHVPGATLVVAARRRAKCVRWPDLGGRRVWCLCLSTLFRPRLPLRCQSCSRHWLCHCNFLVCLGDGPRLLGGFLMARVFAWGFPLVNLVFLINRVILLCLYKKQEPSTFLGFPQEKI